MADAVTSKVVINTPQQHIVHLTNISDGTGEAAVIKVDKSTLLATDAGEPASLDIEWVRWNIQGFTSVRILWDHTTDEVALALSGSGFDDFGSPSDLIGYRGNVLLADGRGAGGAGDILLTTAGAASGATYDITLALRKQPD